MTVYQYPPGIIIISVDSPVTRLYSTYNGFLTDLVNNPTLPSILRGAMHFRSITKGSFIK
jgi:hypothetical protein